MFIFLFFHSKRLTFQYLTCSNSWLKSWRVNLPVSGPIWFIQIRISIFAVAQIVAPLATEQWVRRTYEVTSSSGYVISHPRYPFGRYERQTRAEIHLDVSEQEAVYGFNVTFLDADIQSDCNKDYVMIETDDLTIIDCWCAADITMKGLKPSFYNTTNLTIRFITDSPEERNGFLLFYQSMSQKITFFQVEIKIISDD